MPRMVEHVRLLLNHDDGVTVDFGWHDADAVYAEAFGDVRGLRALHAQSAMSAATTAWWALRPMLLNPRALAMHCGVSYDEVGDAAHYLYRLARGCQDHGVAGTMEVCA
jgi:hypothetical protein